jgi:hypothetical protein
VTDDPAWLALVDGDALALARALRGSPTRELLLALADMLDGRDESWRLVFQRPSAGNPTTELHGQLRDASIVRDLARFMLDNPGAMKKQSVGAVAKRWGVSDRGIQEALKRAKGNGVDLDEMKAAIARDRGTIK